MYELNLEFAKDDSHILEDDELKKIRNTLYNKSDNNKTIVRFFYHIDSANYHFDRKIKTNSCNLIEKGLQYRC